MTTSKTTYRWLALTTIALFTFAVTVLALVADTQRIKRHYPSDQYTVYGGFWTSYILTNGTTIYEPLETNYFVAHLNQGPDKFILASGCVSLAASVLGMFFIFANDHSPSAGKFGILFASLSVGTAFGALVYAMILYTKYGKTQDQYAVRDRSLYTATLEGWTCTLRRILNLSYERKDYGNMCKNSRTARFMTIPLLIVSLAFLHAMVRRNISFTQQTRSPEDVEMAGRTSASTAQDTPPSYVAPNESKL